jgi:potassium efflux system protein
MNFGDNALGYEVRVFVPEFSAYIDAKHALHREIDKRFREADICIAFPQRDLHIKSQDVPIRVTVSQDEAAESETEN